MVDPNSGQEGTASLQEKGLLFLGQGQGQGEHTVCPQTPSVGWPFVDAAGQWVIIAGLFHITSHFSRRTHLSLWNSPLQVLIQFMDRAECTLGHVTWPDQSECPVLQG
jgi:hypothetical protein